MPDDKRPRLSVAVFITDGLGRILLGQRGKEPNKGLWVLPGGGVKFGEPWKAAAQRELYEETGLVIDVGSNRPIVIEVFEGSDQGSVEQEHRIILVVKAKLISTARPVTPGSDLLDAGFHPLHAVPPLSQVAVRMLMEMCVWFERREW